MGRIKTTLQKRISHELFELYPEEFSTDFEVNKEKVNTYADVPSKKLRNTIAGYITRIVKKSQ